MTTSAIDEDDILWFLSDTNTEKVSALQTERHVNVSFADPALQRYVSITGVCQLVRDYERAKSLWSPLHERWFPKGLDDPDLILLKVHVLEAEYWDSSENRMVGVSGFGERARQGAMVHETVALPEDLNR
jgi:general stress protein 26